MKISINLLPPETVAQEQKKAKFYKIEFVGIVIVLTMVFLASLTLALRILQSRNITEVQAKLSQEEERISNLKNTQASLLLLKDRLTVISEYLGVPSKQSLMYRLIDKIVPPAVAINAITLDRSGEITLLAMVPDPVNLDNLVDSLVSKEKNEDKIGQLSIESLNRGRDGLYRISLKIKSK